MSELKLVTYYHPNGTKLCQRIFPAADQVPEVVFPGHPVQGYYRTITDLCGSEWTWHTADLKRERLINNMDERKL